MGKKICIISASLRAQSNSALLADEFARGAIEAGNDVKKISLTDKRIGFCTGCLACQKTGRCVLSDDANAIVEHMTKSEILVFATPVYFYQMCGQLKTLLDRTNPSFTADYAFRHIYLIASAAENDTAAMEGTIKGVQGWIDCFEKSQLAAVIYGVDLTDAGEVTKMPHLLQKAYEEGKDCHKKSTEQ